MRSLLRTTPLLLIVATAAVPPAACGGNVVLDGGPSSGAGASPTTTITVGPSVTGSTVTGFGGNTVTTTTVTGFGGVGGSGTGFGGVGGSGTGFGGVGGVGGSGTGFGGVGVGGSTGIGGGSGACWDANDLQLLENQILYPTLVKCALSNLNNPPGAQMCLQANTGLSPGCVGCLTADLTCSVQACLGPCGSDQMSQPCLACRDANCEAAFVACSGVPYGPGSESCSQLLSAGIVGSGWPQGVPPGAFMSQQAVAAYQAIEECGCMLPSPDGCRSDCDDAFTGSPDFCNGVAASPMCLSCLTTTCGTQFGTCKGI